MAFASTSRHLPRESVYPTPPSSDYLNALEDCVQATEACSRSLQIGLDRFEPGVKDLPRLTKIFKHKHHFLVLPEPTIAAHKAALSHSLAPQIDHLIAKTDSMVESEKTKVGNLEERLRILESARLSASASTMRNVSSGRSTKTVSNTCDDTSSKISGLNMKDLSILQRKKVMQLKAKRDRLEREMARLGR
ncbi:DASH complex subunit SPC19 [Cryptococcus neoformans]|nr:DASH complex subunit SPC19 [Cryptococcus neoformans var. grubii]